MKNAELIDLAANKVGGISEMARQLEWDKGSIAKIKAGKAPMPAYRAAQMAKLIGNDPKTIYLETLRENAATDGERSLLGELLRALKGSAITLTVALALYLATFSASKSAYASTKNSANGQHIHYGALRRSTSWLISLIAACFAGAGGRQFQRET